MTGTTHTGSNVRPLFSLAGLPPIVQRRLGDGTQLREEVLARVADHLANAPRTLQRAVGPSELGTPCPRRLAYRMAGVRPVNDRGVAWKPAVGSAVHVFLADVFCEANRGLASPRWLIEVPVEVGEVAGVPVRGSADLFDRVTATVIDHKIVGLASLRSMKANGPGPQYRAQFHLYARGFVRRGLEVDRVAMLALPQNGEFSEAVWWSEPYREQIALDALHRADAIAALVKAAGPSAAAALPTADAFCSYCPWHLVAATVLAEACPGHRAAHDVGTDSTNPMSSVMEGKHAA
jgi:hypothetical protein